MRSEPAPVIEASGLSVSFSSRRGTVEALKGLDLRVDRGSLFVLLGPNGAGKTTFMRCVTALVRPTGGRIRVFGDGGGPGEGAPAGRDPDRAGRLRRIGVLIENPGAYARLDALEYLTFFGSFYGTSGTDLPGRIGTLCEAFGLALDGKRVAKLSQGNRQKLQLIRSLLHSPELLLWDEPTDHLDPEAQSRVLEYLKGYTARSGATAVVATHRLEQMEGLGTHFGFLREGRLVRAGAREEILGGGAPRVKITFASPVRREDFGGAAGELGLAAEAVEACSAVFSGAGLEGRLPALVKALALRDLPIRAVEPVRDTLGGIYGKVMAPP